MKTRESMSMLAFSAVWAHWRRADFSKRRLAWSVGGASWDQGMRWQATFSLLRDYFARKPELRRAFEPTRDLKTA